MNPARSEGPVIALSGGIGGGKLALGLSRVVPAGKLTVVANTGDDFDHLGLRICPDTDTLVYTLAGRDNKESGWGRSGETWSFMAALEALGGETWFRLGDGDLAMHVERTRRLAAGENLAAITADFCRRLRIRSRVVPMTDDDVRTKILSGGRWIDFQDYFVRQRGEPVVEALRFEGAESAQAQPGFMAALADPALRAIVICPSNPFISVGPILALPGVRAAMRRSGAPIVAVSPIIAGRAIKGPAAKIMAGLGMPASVNGVAAHYGRLIDVLVADEQDAAMTIPPGLQVAFRKTVMSTLEDREALARAVLDVADQFAEAGAIHG